MWDLGTGNNLGVVFTHTGRVSRVIFSKDGEFIISAGSDIISITQIQLYKEWVESSNRFSESLAKRYLKYIVQY